MEWYPIAFRDMRHMTGTGRGCIRLRPGDGFQRFGPYVDETEVRPLCRLSIFRFGRFFFEPRTLQSWWEKAVQHDS